MTKRITLVFPDGNELSMGTECPEIVELREGKRVGTAGMMMYDSEADIGIVVFSVGRSPQVDPSKGGIIISEMGNALGSLTHLAAEGQQGS